jgi:hypothetical protein
MTMPEWRREEPIAQRTVENLPGYGTVSVMPERSSFPLNRVANNVPVVDHRH